MQRALIESLVVTLLLCLSCGNGANNRFVACLPEGVALNEIVSAPQSKLATGNIGKKVTIKETLVRLKAHCKKGNLVDGAGREIHFHRLIGCWGNPPEDYQEQLERQRKELEQLKKKYTVVEIPCAQGDPRRIQ